MTVVNGFGGALNKLWPKAPRATRDAIANAAPEVFQKYGITTPLRVAHFMAQISHECGGGTIIRENMNYSAKRMMEIFGVGVHSAAVRPEEAQQLVGHPEQIAERVYGLGNPKKAKELGNTKAGDGWRYRGGGMLQLTGGYNYRVRGDKVGFDLYNNPDQLNNPTISFTVAAAEFVGLKCLPWADKDDITRVTRLVNGGRNGLSDRMVWLRRWKEAMPGLEEPAWAPRAAELDQAPALLSTRTGQIGTVTGIASATATGSQLINTLTTTTDSIQTVTDTVSGVQDKADQAVVVYQSVKPFLGILPDTWRYLAIGAGVLSILCVIGIIWYRHKKIVEQGE